MILNWKSLQNGSDIRGVASEGVMGEPVTLTVAVIEKIARAFVWWLSKRTSLPAGELSIAVGCDSRISGPALMEGFIHGVLTTGADAVNCGLSSTPAMFMSTIFDYTKFNGSVMLTASHLPFNRNGLKFFTADGGLDKPDITAILDRAATFEAEDVKVPGKESHFNLLSEYSRFLVDTVRNAVNHPVRFNTPLEGFHIVVDAGNGSGGFFCDQVLQPLGAITTGSQFLNPDGLFPNHVPNPEDDAAMQSIQKAVLDNRADFGIIFDTDVDRSAAVDNTGLIINRNRLIALISAIILEEHPGTTIVTDSITSDGLAAFITQNLNGKHHRFKRGYKNVINEAIRLNDSGQESWLAIETSGHAALKENFFLDDGAFLVTKILIKAAKLRMMGGSFNQLTRDLVVPVESREFRLKIKADDFITYGRSIIADLEGFSTKIPGWSIAPDNYEGIRVSCNAENGNGWFLLRLSLHDPVMPLNIETNQAGGVSLIASRLAGFLNRYPNLESDLSC